MHKSLLTSLLMLSLVSCADRPTVGGDPGIHVVNIAALPAPTTGTVYHVAPFDSLVIDVFGIPDLSSREVTVDASGQISFPLLGSIEVAGLTPKQIESLVEQRLSANYVRNPQVTVNVKDAASQSITIEGEVKGPGLYPVNGSTTMLRAMAMAKGTTEFTKTNDVVVFRTVDGQKYAALYDLKGIQRGAYPDPVLYPNDVVEVGDSRARRVFKDFMNVAPFGLGVLILAVQNF